MSAVRRLDGAFRPRRPCRHSASPSCDVCRLCFAQLGCLCKSSANPRHLDLPSRRHLSRRHLSRTSVETPPSLGAIRHRLRRDAFQSRRHPTPYVETPSVSTPYAETPSVSAPPVSTPVETPSTDAHFSIRRSYFDRMYCTLAQSI